MATGTGLLEGRSAVVTGAARGLGEAMARMFAEHGAGVLLVDIDGAAAEAAATAIGRDTGSPALGLHCDVTSEESVSAVVEHAVDRLGSLEVWVNNAGIMRNKSLDEMEVDDFRTLIDVHVQGSWLGTKFAARHMRPRSTGSIVNISSIAGKAGLAGQVNYSTAKAAVLGLTKSAAKELAPDGIRVNAILPGIIRTAMSDMLAPEDLARRLEDVPLRRIGQPEEIAGAALFLASDLSSFMTGATLEVSGGRFM